MHTKKRNFRSLTILILLSVSAIAQTSSTWNTVKPQRDFYIQAGDSISFDIKSPDSVCCHAIDLIFPDNENWSLLKFEIAAAQFNISGNGLFGGFSEVFPGVLVMQRTWTYLQGTLCSSTVFGSFKYFTKKQPGEIDTVAYSIGPIQNGKRIEMLRDTVFVHVIGTTSIDQLKNIPNEFSLEQNYPNPFNPTTAIQYNLAKASDVNISIFNNIGQKVRTLVSEHQYAGTFEVIWDATDDNGNRVPSGMYIYRINAGKFTKIKKMTFMK